MTGTDRTTSRTEPPVLSGQVAIITGASRGIGAATARALSRAGARVVLAARNADALRSLAEELNTNGGTALAVPTDVSQETALRDLVDRTVQTYGRLDLAVNNAAGGGHGPRPLAEWTVGDYDEAITISLRGVFLSMRYEIPALLHAGGGVIINMASTAGLYPVAGLAGYVSAKAAVIGLTRTAALDYASRNIRVNALAPGPILTEQLEQAGPDAQAHAARRLPVGRLGRPDEVAAAVVWL